MGEHSLLTKEKLLEILQGVEKTKNVRILKHFVQAGTAAGDNYSSEVVRCDITALVEDEEKEYHWMAKVTPIKPSFATGSTMEAKEIIFYRDILSRWNKLAEERGASFRLNCFKAPYTELHGEDGKRSILVMQNLQNYGYTNPPERKKGLSLAHAKVVLEEIAIFHALGYTFLTTYPGGVEVGMEENKVFLTDRVYANPVGNVKLIFETAAAGIPDMVEIAQEPGQDLVGIYKKFTSSKDAFGYYRDLCQTNKDGFNVICHGDLWFNNMLFK